MARERGDRDRSAKPTTSSSSSASGSGNNSSRSSRSKGGGGGGGSSGNGASSARRNGNGNGNNGGGNNGGGKERDTLSKHRNMTSPAANNNNNNSNSNTLRSTHTVMSTPGTTVEEDHPDLVDLEQRLTEQVDDEFFQDPRKFHTLHRVIDVLGMQLDTSDVGGGGGGVLGRSALHTAPGGPRESLRDNPAYRVLKDQQRVVEEAIEHLALIHCADLNGSVVQVGRVARQFHHAVTQVRQLRKQVQEIQETLGAGAAVSSNNKDSAAVAVAVAVQSAQSAMSLRELWLKKLEAEAVLALLDKLDRIRAAPRRFDALLRHNRIGAAVSTVAQALDTMFSSDVAQVQALHKIMEQLMLRKQTAEEVVWELLLDVLFLRTGNGPCERWAQFTAARAFSGDGGGGNGNGSGSGTGRGPRKSFLMTSRVSSTGTGTGAGAGASASDHSKQPHHPKKKMTSIAGMGGGIGGIGVDTSTADTDADDDIILQPYGMMNPFLGKQLRYCVGRDLQVATAAAAPSSRLSLARDQAAAAADLQDEFVTEDWLHEDTKPLLFIPPTVMEAEFDLEGEERRHLEEQSYYGTDGAEEGKRSEHNQYNNNNNHSSHAKKPSYGDHVLALRTLVECLVRLRRLDDVERIVNDAMEDELARLVQREQARTFVRVEGSSATQLRKVGRYALLLSKAGAATDLRDFRHHLHSMVAAFGNVQLRLCHLAQIVRHRLATEKTHTAAYATPSAALASTLSQAKDIMERELKQFLDAVLHESQDTSQQEPEFNINALTNVSGQSRQIAAKTGKQQRREQQQAQSKQQQRKNGMETGLFSLGILDASSKSGDKDAALSQAEAWLTASTTSRRSAIQTLTTPKFVSEVLFAKTTQNGRPQIRHALFFRKALAKWDHDTHTLRHQLAKMTLEDVSAPSFKSVDQTPALSYLDIVIQQDLLPVLQEEAVNGTVQALERSDAFDPVLDRNVYARADSNEPQDVDMCRACHALYQFTGPLFLALHRLPKGGDMYLPLVAVLEHVILTFISRVKQQVSRLCSDKTALQLLMEQQKRSSSSSASTDNKTAFGTIMERRKAFAQLVLAYADGDLLEAAAVSDEAATTTAADGTIVPLLSPSASDTPKQQASRMAALGMDTGELDLIGGVEREEVNLSQELQFVKPYLEFAGMEHNTTIQTCSDEHLMKSACLSHSLLKLSSLLDSRLKVRSAVGGISNKTLTNTRALREAIKTIKANGLKMAKFCRADVLLQSVTRLSKICNSSTIVARDAVRIPSSVNDLGEYMTAASDNLREAAGNAVTAYTFSTLEQYIPLCLIQTVRVLAAHKGIVAKAPLTMNGIEALDRSGSVLYRDLKGATSFDHSFWDIELAAVSFERSASFIAMMELEMPELEAYYQENRNDFSDQDFQLMFGMNGPRRKGDIGRYHMLVKRLDQ